MIGYFALVAPLFRENCATYFTQIEPPQYIDGNLSLVDSELSCPTKGMSINSEVVADDQIHRNPAVEWIIPPFSPSESGRNSPVEYGSYSPDMIGGSLNRHPIKIPIPA
jgi:hypothetical protein